MKPTAQKTPAQAGQTTSCFVRPHTIEGLFEVADNWGNTYANSRSREAMEFRAEELNLGRDAAIAKFGGKLDDFCADAIREMRGMPSFNPMRDNGNARRGRGKAGAKFARVLRKEFFWLTDKEIFTLSKWAYERARNWSLISSARAALQLTEARA